MGDDILAIVKGGLKKSVGNGCTIIFLHDMCLGDERLKVVFPIQSI